MALIVLFLPSSLFKACFPPYFFIGALVFTLLTFLTSLFHLSCSGHFYHLSPLTCIRASCEPCAFVCPLCPPFPALSTKEGTVPVFHHRSHCSWPLTSGFCWVMCCSYPWSRIQKLFVCFLQAFVPELCFADLTTVSLFIYKTHALGVYGIGSFLCFILWHDLCGHCPVAFIFSPLLQVGNCAGFICLELWLSLFLNRTLVCLLLAFNIR